jgi:hypothetical protein
MLGSLSAQIALLAFAAAVVAGLAAGNPPTTVLTRALVAMFAALLVAKLVGWTTRLVVRDHLQHKKLAIDQAHRDSGTAEPPEEPGAESDRVGTG